MKILNFGSLNIDYVYSVSHFVQKGETLSSDDLHIYCGGKGLNQSIALSNAGAKVYQAGAIGADGDILVETLRNAGVDTSFIIKLDAIRTGNAIIQNDRQGDNCIILYGGANQAINHQMIDQVLNEFGKDDWLILQNEISEVPYIVEKAHKRGLKIILNPSPMNEKIFKINLNYIDCFILNKIEAQALTEITDDEEFLLKQLKENFSQAEVILTLGEKGAIYAGKEGIIKKQAYKVTAVDTTAAGDTFTGYYLAERFNGTSVNKALDIASKASAIAVSRKGASPSIPVRDEVYHFEP